MIIEMYLKQGVLLSAEIYNGEINAEVLVRYK